MREIEVARGRVVGQRCSAVAVLSSWVVASLLMVALLGCGDATCPAGSQSVDGKCVPANACDGGGECVQDSGVTGTGEGGTVVPDAEPTGPGKRNDAGGTGGSSGSGGAPAADAAQDAGHPDDAATPPEPDPDAGSDAEQPDPDPEPVGPCVGYACGAHGTCEVVADAPRCACNSGFIGERCDRCMPGLGLAGDSCVPACEADDAPDCGAHGACEVVGGAAECACVHPASGTLCNECAEGFKLLADGTCVPDCGDCGPHGYCDGSLMVPDCACYAGYGKEDDACVWVGDGTTGGIRDGELTSPTAWQSRDVAFQDGAVTFSYSGEDVNCEVGTLAQTFHMPTREQAEPLALLLETSTSCTDTNPESCPPLLVEVGSSVTRLRVPGGSGGQTTTHALCLGDAGYGDEVTVRVRPGIARVEQRHPPSGVGSWPAGWACNTDWPSLRKIEIRVPAAGACEFGAGVRNTDFATNSHWTVNAGATIKDGLLTLPNEASANTDVLVTAASGVIHPAVRITARSTSTTSRLEVKLDGLPVSSLSLGNAHSTQYVCLPDWARGAVHELELAAVLATEVETVTFGDEPACGSGAFDAGFELPVGTGSWFVHPTALTISASNIVADPIAYAGRFSASVATTFMAATMRVPEAQGSARAALGLVARTNASNVVGNLSFQANPPAYTGSAALEDSLNWQPVTLCIGSIWNGQLFYVVGNAAARLASSGGSPRVLLDEFAVGNSVRCRP